MKKQFARAFAVLAAAALLFLGVLAGRYLEAKKEKAPDLSSSAIAAQISQLSELSTAELAYRGLVRYSDGDIAFLTKKEFTMIYDAYIKAGLDLSQASVSVKGNKVVVHLPEASVLDVSIDPDSLEFYDEKSALFNFQNKEDTVKALQYAQEDVEARAMETDLLKTAEEKARDLITGFITTLWQDRAEEVEILFQTATEKDS